MTGMPNEEPTSSGDEDEDEEMEEVDPLIKSEALKDSDGIDSETNAEIVRKRRAVNEDYDFWKEQLVIITIYTPDIYEHYTMRCNCIRKAPTLQNEWMNDSRHMPILNSSLGFILIPVYGVVDFGSLGSSG